MTFENIKDDVIILIERLKVMKGMLGDIEE